MSIDVLSVGDIVTDAFIKLMDDQAHANKDDKGRWLTMPFGVKIPYDHVEVLEAVGNAPNASVSFSKLGLKSALMANVGGDQNGRDMIASLENSKVDTRFIKVNTKQKSNYHYVLWYKAERTILIKHEEYKYHWPHLRPDEIPKWIYFSSISKNAEKFQYINMDGRHQPILVVNRGNGNSKYQLKYALMESGPYLIENHLNEIYDPSGKSTLVENGNDLYEKIINISFYCLYLFL